MLTLMDLVVVATGVGGIAILYGGLFLVARACGPIWNRTPVRERIGYWCVVVSCPAAWLALPLVAGKFELNVVVATNVVGAGAALIAHMLITLGILFRSWLGNSARRFAKAATRSRK